MSYPGLTWSERLTVYWERFWYCQVQRDHMVKFGSFPNCVRCGRKAVEPL